MGNVNRGTTGNDIDKENILSEAINQINFTNKKKPIYTFLKRLFDILFSVFCLILLAIPMAIVSLVIILTCPGASPIFVQDRVGKNGKKFKMYKFRSMVPNAEKMLDSLLNKNEMNGPVFKIKNDPRITKFGKFIRKTSIDELPQLVNILMGDMSFVGPRPPLIREVMKYNAYQLQRLSVKPGLTCYWQIQPRRNEIDFDDWVELDLKYIEDRNLFLDLMIILKTYKAVLGFEGQ